MNPILERFCVGSNVTAAELENRFNPKRPIGREEQIHRFDTALYALYWQAERARKLGISWRNFCVGCSMWAFQEDGHSYESRWRVFYGMNTKIAEESRNICAEPVPLGAAYASAYSEIVGMVIVGEPQPDENGHTHLTLRPCPHCRLLMKNHPLIKSETIIVMAHPPIGEPESLGEVVHEAQTFQELLAEYGEI